MTAVPDNVLRWLYDNLKSEYRDVNRTYSDVAQTLSQYTSLKPRTEVHTFENGASALLLVLQGTLLAQFRGSTYRFPIAVWIPYGYPREPPMAYVTPTRDMSVRAGQHVSREGRIYHPYLAQWLDNWNRSNIVDLLSIIREVFSKEPPVIAKPPQQSPIQPRPTPPPPIPPLPVPPGGLSTHQPGAPPPPPKPSDGSGRPFHPQGMPGGQSSSTSASLPPLPPKLGQARGDPSNGSGGSYTRPPSQGPPLPPLPQDARLPARRPEEHNSRQSSNPDGRPPLNNIQYERQFPQSPHPQQSSHGYQTPSAHNYAPYPQHHPQQHSQPPYPYPTYHQAPPPPKQPPPDLLTSPLDGPLPSNSTITRSQPAPPIPPNPEKDALLSTISSTLLAALANTIAQNTSAIPSLQAQHAAMQRAEQALQSELAQLQHLDAVVTRDEQILREAMREAENMEAGLKGREVPGVDEVLVAPTMVGEQLYGLAAEERGIADAMFVLGRALDGGRVGGEVFVKQTRSLAREQFLKKALIKKIARGMGLATG